MRTCLYKDGFVSIACGITVLRKQIPLWKYIFYRYVKKKKSQKQTMKTKQAVIKK